jgi:hypothetical protein
MKTLALPFFILGALAGCASHDSTPYQAPAADASATLRVDALNIAAVKIYADGDHCGSALNLPADVNPLHRQDRTVTIPATGKPVAVWLEWPHKSSSNCTAIVKFTPVPKGSYRLSDVAYVEHCDAVVEAIPGTRTDAVATMQMRQQMFHSDACIP